MGDSGFLGQIMNFVEEVKANSEELVSVGERDREQPSGFYTAQEIIDLLMALPNKDVAVGIPCDMESGLQFMAIPKYKHTTISLPGRRCAMAQVAAKPFSMEEGVQDSNGNIVDAENGRLEMGLSNSAPTIPVLVFGAWDDPDDLKVVTERVRANDKYGK